MFAHDSVGGQPVADRIAKIAEQAKEALSAYEAVTVRELLLDEGSVKQSLLSLEDLSCEVALLVPPLTRPARSLARIRAQMKMGRSEVELKTLL